ncbi:hypothetical protein FA15DRAFT_347247 [Coprinopsis marcescibilis]|uniref:Yeast cell wall synthesis Kre9/Knh1-like N-terminal domain-containing protein n=1 Tax=Coprinopsis marcescibilis TaxID=230819 RepID=A0A5C3LA16_COPMA|nr:hypothetical protein FA15DRAFT_347247 [Coprinopsis marcescibilis]
MFYLLFVLATLFLATLVKAELYVVEPFQDSTCHGGEPCTVTWLDNGSSPLLAAIGVVSVGLYTGDRQLVQTLDPADVSAVRSLTFTPNPAAGPDSRAYYLSFTSTTLLVNGTEPYYAYSPWFGLDRMSGSFEAPVESATRSIPIPSTLSTRRSTTVLSTITIGDLSTAPATPSASSIITSASLSVPSSEPSNSESSAPSSSSFSSSSESSTPLSSGFVTSRIVPSPQPSATSSSEPAASSEDSSSQQASSTPRTGADLAGSSTLGSGAGSSVSISLPLSLLASMFIILAM